jgi:hypothetical protein
MLTAEDGAKMKDLKARVLANKPVSDVEKQWILDKLKQEKSLVNPKVVQAARNSGFNVDGILVK